MNRRKLFLLLVGAVGAVATACFEPPPDCGCKAKPMPTPLPKADMDEEKRLREIDDFMEWLTYNT